MLMFKRTSNGVATAPRRAASIVAIRHIRCRASSAVAPPASVSNAAVALVPLLGGVRAHESSLSAARVLEDSKDGERERASDTRSLPDIYTTLVVSVSVRFESGPPKLLQGARSW